MGQWSARGSETGVRCPREDHRKRPDLTLELLAEETGMLSTFANARRP